MTCKPSRPSPPQFVPTTTVPSTHSLTRREVLATALVAGALGGDAAAQESGSGSGESTPTAGEGDWPSFQDGPRNAGYAPSARGPVKDGAVSWARPLAPAGVSSPAVVDGAVYVGTLRETVVALSAADGSELWEFETEAGVASSPAVADRSLYVGCNDGRVYALWTANGAERWSFETGDRVESSPAVAEVPAPGATEAPTATGTAGATGASGTTGASGATETAGTTGTASTASEEDSAERTVFVGSDDGTLYALGATDGSVRWTYDVGLPVGSPAVRVPGDDTASGGEPRVYVGDSKGGVYALSAVDGAEQWTADVSGAVTAPTVADGSVYVAARGGLVALSAADGTKQWEFSPSGEVGSPALADDSLYVPVSEDGLYALSATDGTERWDESLGQGIRSPAVAGFDERDSSGEPGGTVYVPEGEGEIIVRALSAADGSQRWAAEVDGKRAAAPAVVEETLYLNAGVVAALDEEGRTPTPTRTAWDADAVLGSWAPTFGAWLGTSLGVPAVLGALVYALGRFGGDSRGRDGTSDGDSEPGAASGPADGGPDVDSSSEEPD